MKKTNGFPLVLILLFLASLSATAQNRNFKVGIKAGTNLSSLSGNELVSSNDPSIRIGDKSTRLTGFVGGVFFRLGSKIFVQPELLLSQKGGNVNVFRSGAGNQEQAVKVRFTNLDVPVLLGIRIGEVFRINAGPVASLRLSENGGLQNALNEVGANGVAANFKRVALGYQVGVGFDIGNINLDLRYEGNASNIIDTNTASSNFNSQLKRKNNLFQATLGFVIF